MTASSHAGIVETVCWAELTQLPSCAPRSTLPPATAAVTAGDLTRTLADAVAVFDHARIIAPGARAAGPVPSPG